jgi:Ca-activated chloride channel family protein
MEQIADKGNGAYHYIDSAREGHRVLVDKLDASLMTIAKDVKVQVEFNPTRVASYRLIGYANRLLAKKDFNDDTKDAGEMGAGHTVTALYEVVPVGVAGPVDDLRYTRPKPQTEDQQEFGEELMFVKVRYKHPTATTSQKLTQPVLDDPRSFDEAPADLRFAAAVAAFGMILRDSPHKGSSSFQQVLALAEGAMGQDENGYRSEFLQLVQSAQALMGDKR